MRRLAPLALALGLAACTVQTQGTFVAEETIPEADSAEGVVEPDQLIFEHGVTLEPCAEAVNPDNGCIHLGAIVDLSGPFAEVGESALAGAQAFWAKVNEEGGVFGAPGDGREARFDVDIDTHVADNEYVPDIHLQQLEEMAPNILALGLSHGTQDNVEALHHYKMEDLVAAPLDWWSGWPFEPIVADTGTPYCLQALNAADYALHLLGGGTPFSDRGPSGAGGIVVVHTPERFGLDVAKGIEFWTEEHQVPFSATEHVVAVPVGGEITEAVEKIREVRPDAVFVAIAPGQLAELAHAVAEMDWTGYIAGVAPTFVPDLLEDETVARVLTEQYFRVDPYPPLEHQAEAYHEMREHLDGELPENHFWVAGWMNQYPILEAIKHGLELGDITRPGLLHGIEEVTVKYDGGLRRRQYRADVTAETPRSVWVYTPDGSAALGERAIAANYVGNTARDFALTRPCSEN